MNSKKIYPFYLTFLSLLFLFGSLLAQEDAQSSKKGVLTLRNKSQWIRIERIGFDSKDKRLYFDSPLQITAVVDIPEKKQESSVFIEKYVKEHNVRPKKIVFKISLLMGERDKAAASMDTAELGAIIKGLSSFLKYDYYALLDSFEIQFSDELAEVLTKKLRNSHAYKIELQKPEIIEENNEQKVDTAICLKKGEDTLFKSELSLKNGETAVVGASRPSDSRKGILIIVRARLIDSQ